MPCIDSFPSEILLDIFELAVEGVTYKERQSTLRSLALVRTDWTAPAQSLLWREIELEGQWHYGGGLVNDPRVRMFSSNRITLGTMETRKLKLRWLSKEDAEEVIVACHGLQELSVWGIHQFNFKLLEISSIAGLKTLQIYRGGVDLPEDDSQLSFPFQLDVLRLCDINLPFVILSPLVATASLLELLDIDINEPTTTALVQHASRWTTLSILFCVTNGNLGRILSQCASLVDLKIEGFEISELAQLPARLEILRLLSWPSYRQLRGLFGESGPGFVKSLKKLWIGLYDLNDEQMQEEEENEEELKRLCKERNIVLEFDY